MVGVVVTNKTAIAAAAVLVLMLLILLQITFWQNYSRQEEIGMLSKQLDQVQKQLHEIQQQQRRLVEPESALASLRKPLRKVRMSQPETEDAVPSHSLLHQRKKRISQPIADEEEPLPASTFKEPRQRSQVVRPRVADDQKEITAGDVGAAAEPESSEEKKVYTFPPMNILEQRRRKRFNYTMVGERIAECYFSSRGVRRVLQLSVDDQGMWPGVCTDGGWEKDAEVYFWNSVRDGGHIVEFGSNIGYFSQLFATAVKTAGKGRVTLVEGNPSVFRMLKAGIVHNGDLANYVSLNNNVLSMKDGGFAEFCDRPSYPMNGYLVLPDRDCHTDKGFDSLPARTVKVPQRTAASFFEFPPSKYTLVKVDVDHAEGLVWKSMLQYMKETGEKFPHVTAELNARRSYESTMTFDAIVNSMYELYGKVGVQHGTECVEKTRRDRVWQMPKVWSDVTACLRADGQYSPRSNR